MKKSVKLKSMVVLGTVATSISAAVIPINVATKNQNIQGNIKNNSENTNISTSTETNATKESALVPFDFNESWPLLVQNTGPIVSCKNQISSLDWFSSTRWTLDILNAEFNNKKIFGDSPQFVKYTDRAFINWALDRNNNILWLLSNSTVTEKKEKVRTNNPDEDVQKYDPSKQKLIKINSLNGEILDVIEIADNPETINLLYYSISVLDSGNIMIYGQGNDKWEKFDILDTQTNSVSTKESSNKDLDQKIEEDLQGIKKQNNQAKGDVRSRFIFSIAPNMNILVMTNFGWPNVSGYQKENFGDIYFAFVDDNLNRIVTNSSDEWYYAKKMIERTTMDNLNSESDTFPKLVYKLPDGRVLFSIYNKLYIFFPTETQKQKKPVFKEFDYGVKTTNADKYLPVESWTTDTDNNVYAKFSNDSRIQKVSISGSTQENTNISISTYYNIDGNQDKVIKDNAKNFVLYNVYGYSGQIMMLNPRKITDKKDIKPINESEPEKPENNGIGIAVAITKNKNGDGGDSKGYLNTDKAFIKSADFNIEGSILQNKLPSEISRNDLKITYDGFFTQNTTKKPNGELKYPQFVKEIMNDDKGSAKKDNEGNLKITANIDQIPWFVSNNVMPSDIPPLTITKWFNTKNNISERISWKDVNLDYDFKNTLPSKVTLDDVKRFDPFAINITSQQTTINGEKYPKKEYSISEQKDETGKIKITAKFSYLPIDVETKQTNVKTASFDKEYTLFKKTDSKEFKFVGNNNDTEDIRNIPQLKELSESNLLPSSISSSDSQSILRFVNTDSSKGYPLSKMEFTVSPNDINGSLKITGRLPKDYYNEGQDKVFTKTYTGLNRTADYTFTVNENPFDFNKKNYRPSDIDEQIIYKHFLTYKGYNSSSLEIVLTPNDDTGELNIKFILDKSYPDSVANNVNGFVKTDYGFVLEKTITGFKTNQEYETQYQVVFLDDNDSKLDDVKKFTPKQIEQSLKKEEKQTTNKVDITIDGKKITSEKEFSLALIESLGSSIPSKENLQDNNFSQEIYYNDPNGEITVKLTFKSIPGASGNLVFIQRFTGFAKGNQVTTDDILSFKTESKLFLDNPEFKNQLPSELASKLNKDTDKQSEIKKYINYYSGAYQSAIESNKFKLEVVPNDIYGYLTIKITFERTDISNPESLLTYTATYSGFATE